MNFSASASGPRLKTISSLLLPVKPALRTYAGFLTCVVTVSLAPIVTLVICFYFGSEQKNE